MKTNENVFDMDSGHSNQTRATKHRLISFGSVTLMLMLCGLIAMATGCGKHTQDQQPGTRPAQTVSIGAILPLTGNASVLGAYVQQGIQVAANEVNAAGGINGRMLKVVMGDSKNDPKEGLSVYRKLLDIDHVKAVICSMSSVSSALVPIAENDQTVLFATTVSASKFAAKSPWVFRLFITADIDATTAAKFARQHMSAKTAAILHVQDDMGKSFATVFDKTFTGNGGKVVMTEGFDATMADFKNLAAKLNGQMCDVIYLLGYDKNLGILLKQLREANIKTPILSIATVGEPYVLDQAGQAAEGVYFTSTLYDAENPRTEIAKAFVAKSESLTGKKPNYFAAFAHDSMLALCLGLKNVSDTENPDALRAAISALPPFEGVVGTVSFDKDREASFPMIVKQIKNGRPVEVQ